MNASGANSAPRSAQLQDGLLDHRLVAIPHGAHVAPDRASAWPSARRLRLRFPRRDPQARAVAGDSPRSPTIAPSARGDLARRPPGRAPQSRDAALSLVVRPRRSAPLAPAAASLRIGGAVAEVVETTTSPRLNRRLGGRLPDPARRRRRAPCRGSLLGQGARRGGTGSEAEALAAIATGFPAALGAPNWWTPRRRAGSHHLDLVRPRRPRARCAAGSAPGAFALDESRSSGPGRSEGGSGARRTDEPVGRSPDGVAAPRLETPRAAGIAGLAFFSLRVVAVSA